ncbi:hypothetical protein GJW-30_1_00070 [Variibacter gotjawalensis]|uniref:Uncharacterized protein n=1 Tax=Variibacter gotjawalensis TaxID=1333996 RepID=A0A0S3PNW4_9BRAD|nr:hypothetical protein [Variibacter gotjawalensis]RZS49736.1 hypothetical protein EV661_2176 [Variibacter gotjawalensis]BAT57564.1 hypothetical protein GJW-30_1_00070 [Variibacter gotjawalensis]
MLNSPNLEGKHGLMIRLGFMKHRYSNKDLISRLITVIYGHQ